MVRIRVDLPAPFGPRRPYIPGGIVKETLSNARTPLGYALDRPSIRSSMKLDLRRGTTNGGEAEDDYLYESSLRTVPSCSVSPILPSAAVDDAIHNKFDGGNRRVCMVGG